MPDELEQYELHHRARIAIKPGIPFFVKGSIPENLDLHILYLLNLAATVFSYWLFAYKNSLLMAHQRTDVTSKISLAINTVQFLTQFLGVEFGVAGTEQYKKGRRSGKPPESSGGYPRSDLYLRDVLLVRTDRHAR